MALKFEKPPTTRGFSGDWAVVTAELRANAGQWALLGEGVKVSLGNAIRQSSIASVLPANGYEITMRNTQRTARPPTCDLYIRYTAARDENLTVKEREAALRLEKKNAKEKENE